jgi:FkbM family methyltransferase
VNSPGACNDGLTRLSGNTPPLCSRFKIGRHQPYSRAREDLTVLEKWFLRNGGDAGIPRLWSDGLTRATTFVFLEMGAFDGCVETNTALFERCLNWTGVLIEANPTLFPVLKRTGRTGSFIVSAATGCPRNSANGFGAQSEIVRMGITQRTNSQLATATSPVKETEADVACTDLSSVLDRVLAGLPKASPDFFSLDVEGAELVVLKTLDFARHQPGLIIVESWNAQCKKVCPKRDAVRGLMSDAGYKLDTFRVGFSDTFVPSGPGGPTLV